jgi:hypothetical protein
VYRINNDWAACDMVMSIDDEREARTDPKLEKPKAAPAHSSGGRIREILGHFWRRKSRLFRKTVSDSLVGAEQKSNLEMAELLMAGSELVDATEVFLQSATETELARPQLQRRWMDLLAIYDEYLDILKKKLEARNDPSDAKDDIAQREDLTKLFVAFDHDRQLLAGVLILLKEESGEQGRDSGTGRTEI